MGQQVREKHNSTENCRCPEFVYIDTGAMYRALTLRLSEQNRPR